MPQKVILFCHPRLKDRVSSLIPTIDTLLRGYDVDPDISLQIVPERDFIRTAQERITEVVREEKRKGNEVALDVTPARKSLALPAYLACINEKVDHIFYLFLRDLRHSSRPYPMIPFFMHDPRDFVKEF